MYFLYIFSLSGHGAGGYGFFDARPIVRDNERLRVGARLDWPFIRRKLVISGQMRRRRVLKKGRRRVIICHEYMSDAFLLSGGTLWKSDRGCSYLIIEFLNLIIVFLISYHQIPHILSSYSSYLIIIFLISPL